MESFIESHCKSPIVSSEHVQTLWEGYGSIQRISLAKSPEEKIIAKYINSKNTYAEKGKTMDKTEMKIKSYHIENIFYQKYSKDLKKCKIPNFISSDFSNKNEFLLIMEDLNQAGFSGRFPNR